MAALLKNLHKSLSNFNFSVKLPTLNNKNNSERLLLQRWLGGPVDDTPYFSALSPEDFSPTKKIYSHLCEDFKVVVGSRNGLVCLDNTTSEALLWNPSTDEFQIIPSHHISHAASAFKTHSFSSGFGYVPKSHDFKLIRFICDLRRADDGDDDSYVFDDFKTELYSLRSNSWKCIDDHGFFVMRNPSAYVDGCSYWLAYDVHSHFILGFDYGNEILTSHPLPNVGKPFDLDFVEFEGSLGVVVFPKLGTDKSFHLWFGDGKNWSKEYEFCVPGAERPLGFWGRLLFLEGLDSRLMVYDIDSRKIRKLDIYDYPRQMRLVPYVDTSVSIKGLLGSDSKGRKE